MKTPATLILASLGSIALSTNAADLKVEVNGVRSAQGQVKLMLFDRADGFRKEDKARKVLLLPATPGTVSGAFKDLPPGRYAITAYHDEDGDSKLKLRFGMFPLEGHGLSNNPSVSGPPSFRDAAFDMPDNGSRVVITLLY